MKNYTNQRAAKLEAPVFPQTLHELRLNHKKAMPNPKPKRWDNILFKSRDLREDRCTREMKTLYNDQPFHARQFSIHEKNPLKGGALTEKSPGLGTVTRAPYSATTI